MATETKEVLHKSGNPLKITLQKSLDSTYTWQITLAGSTMDEILPLVKKIDDRMRAQYGGGKK